MATVTTVAVAAVTTTAVADTEKKKSVGFSGRLLFYIIMLIACFFLRLADSFPQ